MGFVVKGGCEYECEREYFHNGEIFATLRKAINTIKSDVAWHDFFYEYDGEFYIYDTETGDKIHYHYDGEKIKRIKLYKNEKPKYKVKMCGPLDFDDAYCKTLREAFDVMKSTAMHVGSSWFVLVNLETNEKKLYSANKNSAHCERDPFFINLYSKDLR